MAEPYYYYYFDRVLETPVALPELAPALASEAVSLERPILRVELGDGSSVPSPSGAPLYREDTENPLDVAPVVGGYRLRFAPWADFYAYPAEQRIVVCGAAETEDITLRHLLLDQALPRLLGQLGSLIVHASAVVHEERALVFVGPSGAGKSTLAAALRGETSLLADDCVLLESSSRGAALASSACSSLRLWPDSLEALGVEGDGGRLARESAKWRQLARAEDGGGPIDRFELGGLFFLDDPLTTPIDKLRMRPAGGQASLMALLGRCFLLDNRAAGISPHLLGQAAALLRSGVPAMHLAYPRDFDLLPTICERLLQVRDSATFATAV